MTARTGKEYIAGLADQRQVWLGSEKVSVVDNPAFEGSLRGIAGYFDWQYKYADDCLIEDPETGKPMNVSLIVPHNKADLVRRHRGFERLARYSYGMLGRTPDYVNVVLSGHVARPDIYAKSGDPVHHERLKRFHREVIDKDLALTHTIIHAAVDKSVGEFAGMNADLTLKAVKRTSNGLIVRGAKVLATLGPFSDELFVYPSTPIQAGNEDYALSFSVPVGTKGIITICRDHYSVDATIADRPFSSRFDEQDAFVVFDDVEVPWERVFVDGNLAVYNSIVPGTSAGNVSQQIAVRAAVKLEFAYDLCTQVARVTNSEGRPEVAQMLGELWTYLTLTRSMISAAETAAYDWGAGAFFCHGDLYALRNVMPGWMVRVNDIIKTLGSHNLLATPTLAAFDNSEIGPFLERYLPGANGISARDRARIMRTAWDFAGSALGSRTELYERFYLASPQRNMINDHNKAQKNEAWGQVRSFLAQSGVVAQ